MPGKEERNHAYETGSRYGASSCIAQDGSWSGRVIGPGWGTHSGWQLTLRMGSPPPPAAYMLRSVSADLRIGEIVDQPNWTVSLYFQRAVLEQVS